TLEILELIATLRDSLADSRKRALAQLAPLLPTSLIGQALAQAQLIDDRSGWLAELPRLFPHLREMEQQIAWQLGLTQAIGIEREWRISEFIVALASALPDSLLPSAMDAARCFEQPALRGEALTALVPRLPKPLQRTVVDEALGYIR